MKQSLSSRPCGFFINKNTIMFNKLSMFLSAFICFAGTVFAQSQPCSTDEHHQDLLVKYPELAEFEQQFHQQLRGILASRTTSSTSDTEYYDVPIVVHVVHDYGVENLKDDDIYEAAKNWAKAFVKENADTAVVIDPFKPYIGNARLKLHLATIDPNGNPTKGVVRHYSYLTHTADDQAKYESWPHNKYINIWFVNSFGSSGAAAYAYYPSVGAFRPNYDGVISLYNYLDRSKTIPHELGHVLNLQHVWGNNNNAAVACGDDEVDDTPPTKGHSPGCIPTAIYDVTCATGYSKTYVSSSGLADSLVDYPDTTNSQNIMDYTYCSNMFTIGQCYRMRAAITSSVAGRNNLITPANIAATGALAPMPDLPPVADFYVGRSTAAGIVTDAKTRFLTFTHDGKFTFSNASWNDTVSSVHWEFSNGAQTPVSSSMTTVENKFSVPGWVTVTLTATSNAGSNTIVNTSTVYAADTTPRGGLDYSQQFANAGHILDWPMINYYENQFKWEFHNGSGKGDNGCIGYHSYDATGVAYGEASGDYDDVFTPAFNLEGLSGDVYVNFYTAGASRNGRSSDTRDSMELQVSTSGGARWVKLEGYNGIALANNGNRFGNFEPSSTTEWVGRSVSIPEIYRNRETFFRLRFRPGVRGNNLYVDDFRISALPVNIQGLAGDKKPELIIYPNPSSNGTNIAFKTGNDGIATYTIRDVAGKVIYSATRTGLPNSIVNDFISRSEIPLSGMYFVSLVNGSSNITKKLTIY